MHSLAEAVFNFQEKMDELMAMEDEIETEVLALDACAYSSSVFGDVLGRIQRAVDNLSLHQYSNLPQWVAKLDQQVGRQQSLIVVDDWLEPLDCAVKKIIFFFFLFNEINIFFTFGTFIDCSSRLAMNCWLLIQSQYFHEYDKKKLINKKLIYFFKLFHINELWDGNRAVLRGWRCVETSLCVRWRRSWRRA